MPKIAATIIGPTEEDALRDMDLAVKQGADIIEIRYDFFTGKVCLKKLHEHNGLEKIFTPRHKSEAGSDTRAGFKGTEEERRSSYEEAVSLGFFAIDVEDKNSACLPSNLKSSKLILSWHDFKHTPGWSELWCIFKGMYEKRPDFVKIATKAETHRDNKEMLDFSEYVANEYPDQKKLFMTQGPLCEETRVCGPDYGSAFVYACLEGKQASAGQPTIKGLREKWKQIGHE